MGLGSLAKARHAGAVRSPKERDGADPLKIHTWAPAFTGFGGGISAFSRELAVALRDLGHDVRLFGKMDRSGDFNRLPLWGTSKFTRVARSHAFAAGVLASAARHRPNHIISTHVNFAPVAEIARRTLGIPFTLVAHGIDIHPGLPSSVIGALRAADRIIAVSSWTRLRVLDLGGIDPENVVILHNTLDEERFKPAEKPAELLERYGIRRGEKVIVTVARLASDERYKGYDRIIRALPALQRACGDIRFVLVGKGEDAVRLEALAGVLGVRRNVTFAGFVPDRELADHYRLADAFAMPSTGEGFGIVFLESMGCGVPVVAGNRDGSVDALDGGRLGRLVDPIDVNAISDGILSLLRCDGPALWFNKEELSGAVRERFGRRAFRETLQGITAAMGS
jgi:glycosyltransferase involved in cell wall biosynthesis